LDLVSLDLVSLDLVSLDLVSLDLSSSSSTTLSNWNVLAVFVVPTCKSTRHYVLFSFAARHGCSSRHIG